MDIAVGIGIVLIYLIIFILCLAAVILSCLSLSGTWLVAAASILSYFLPGDQFAGWVCVAIFLVVSSIVEVLESVAASLGVAKRGGSKLAGAMAFVGGIAGAILGSFIPVPLLGSLIGMFVLSFILVYAVEYNRLKKHGHAADIATGTVIARVIVILLKVTMTMAMILYLWGSIMLKAF